MKKLQKQLVLLLAMGLILGFIGCEEEDKGKYDKYYEGDFRGNRNGTVEVVNNTSHDMLLFSGEKTTPNNIVGGVRAYSSNTVNFSGETDYTVGGYKVIHAVKESEFDKLGEHSRRDHSAMVTYRDGAKFRTNIVSTTDGAFQFTVHNKNTQYALELRKNTPEGEKVAYLTRAEHNRVINSPSSTQMRLFPVWIAFNTATKTIVSFSPSDAGDTWEGQRNVSPRSPTDPKVEYNFPDSNIEITWANVEFPFATVIVRNTAGRDINFRNDNMILPAQSNYDSIPSGFRDTYEINDGKDMNLNIYVDSTHIIQVRFKDAPAASTITLEKGYVYDVSISLKPGADASKPESYEVTIEKSEKLEKKDLLTSG